MLIIPAVQASRESTRRTQCIANCERLTRAATAHRDVQFFYPTGGWGSLWVGDPDRGFGREQPGGWGYNILPYLSYQNLHDTGKGASENQKKFEAAHMVSTLLPEFICVSRREKKLYPIVDKPHNCNRTKFSAHTDYAINRGDVYEFPGPGGPESYNTKDYKWQDTSRLTGVSFARSMIHQNDITDGESYTYLLGEKYLDPWQYDRGDDWGDNGSVYEGDDMDIARVTGFSGQTLPPLPDTPRMKDRQYIRFGSAHPTTWQASFCDGAVRCISFEIDPELHRKLGNRKDGVNINVNSIPTE